MRKVYISIKGVLDRLIALISLIVLSPIFLICAIVIKLESRGRVLFKQQRVGKNKKIFYIYKFRTMKTTTPKDVPTRMLEDAESYITRFGNFMRKTSIDELPQLINILKGEMSIIGPRPVLWNETELIKERDKYEANSIKPGLTGLAQISGRDKLDNIKKAELDGEYVKKISLWLDIKIFLITIYKVIRGDGIVEGTQNTNKEDRIYENTNIVTRKDES